MRIFNSIVLSLVLLSSAVAAASSWSFDDATLTVQGKGEDVGGGLKDKLSPSSPLSKQVTLGASASLKVILTTTENKSGKRPQQAFLTLHETSTGLEESFPLIVKENGKGKVEITQKDLPYQLATSSMPLKANLVIASFGSSTPLNAHAFDLTVSIDPNTPIPAPSPQVRYHQLPLINHIFRADPRSPPYIISLFFTLAVLATFPALLGAWVMLGGNLDHVGKAFGAAPAAHTLFFGSIVAMEGVFFLYYTTWNLFQILPPAAVVGTVLFISGSRALTEVQERRLAGER